MANILDLDLDLDLDLRHSVIVKSVSDLSKY